MQLVVYKWSFQETRLPSLSLSALQEEFIVSTVQSCRKHQEPRHATKSMFDTASSPVNRDLCDATVCCSAQIISLLQLVEVWGKQG